MKKLLLIIISILFIQLPASTQTCPGPIYFYTQNDIDSFQTDYPGCTEIDGDVIIRTISGEYINNLNGLSVLTSIIGDLSIFGQDSLTSLTGLEGLTSIDGELRIYQNELLNNLNGLVNIDAESIDELYIHTNHSLSDCEVQSICDYLGFPSGSINIYDNATGCNNPTEVANGCGVTLNYLPYGNYYFLIQSDIDNFQTNYPGCYDVEGDVCIGLGTPFLPLGNSSNFTSLDGLSVMSSISGNLTIANNDSLVSLTGLENITAIGQDLNIGMHQLLYGGLWVFGNKSLTSISGLSGIESIGGNLSFVGNNAMISLAGLSSNISIGGELRISYNDSLTSLTGLEIISTLGGELLIWNNNNLMSLAGLENLTTIGGHLSLSGNQSLTSLTGLEGLSSIGGGGIMIGDAWTGNSLLTSLTGLDNIDAASIDYLAIRNNSSLSTCEVQSICNYLVSPNGFIEIHDNAQGCNSRQEVEDACALLVNEDSILFGIKTQPNPFNTSTTIEYELKQPEKVILMIYDYLGKQVYQTEENQLQGKQQLIWNAEGYADGIYYFRLQVGDAIANGKMVKVR